MGCETRLITEGQRSAPRKTLLFLKKEKSGTLAQSRNLTNSYCKITPGQPTTLSINISQDQQPRQMGEGENDCMNFLKVKIVPFVVGKEGVHPFPYKMRGPGRKERF